MCGGSRFWEAEWQCLRKADTDYHLLQQPHSWESFPQEMTAGTLGPVMSIHSVNCFFSTMSKYQQSS